MSSAFAVVRARRAGGRGGELVELGERGPDPSQGADADADANADDASSGPWTD
jgi:hypothetical protein